MFGIVPFGRRDRNMLDQYRNDFDRFFDMFNSPMSMSTDIVDLGDSYELTCELPGMTKDDIKVSINDNQLVIMAEQDHKREEKDEDYVLQERRSCNFRRSFDISGIDKDNISGSYKDGILILNLPKVEKDDDDEQFLEIDFGD